MKNIYKQLSYLVLAFALSSCATKTVNSNPEKLKPVFVTEKVNHDTDDPAIWINPKDPTKSLIIGTDKDTNGGLFAYDFSGKIVNRVENLQRPNNVDIRYGFLLNGKSIDIAAVTERETNKVKIYSLPELKEVGEFSVFDGEQMRDPMGISLYKNPTTKEIFAIVGRKNGPSGTYLWQYKLVEKNGKLQQKL
jgi:3-phytase